MGETAHQLHTPASETPEGIDESANLNLSPRSPDVGGQSASNPAKTGDLPGQAGTRRDTICRGFAHANPETAHELHTDAGPTAHDELNLSLEQTLNLRLAQLELLPGSISGKDFERASAGVERGIPVDMTGKAKGDVSVFVFRKRISHAKSTRARLEVLSDIEAAISEVTVSKRRGRPEYDLGVQEGRRNAGRLAVEHGVKYACQSLRVPRSTMYRYKAEYERSMA